MSEPAAGQPPGASAPAAPGGHRWSTRLRHSALRRALAPRRRHAALALLCMVLALGSAERSALSVASPALVAEPGFDTTVMGWLMAAFGWSYVLAHLPVGLVVTRYGVRRVTTLGLAGGALVSLGMAAAGAPWWAAQAAWIMLGLRLLLGVVQSPLGSISGVVLAQWFPAGERGVAGAVYTSIPYLSFAVLNPLMGWLTQQAGWRTMFVAMGVLGLGATALWWRGFILPAEDRRLSARERRLLQHGGAMWPGRRSDGQPGTSINPSGLIMARSTSQVLRVLFTHRMMVGTLTAQYTVNAITWFFVGWFPLYLVQDQGASVAQAAALSAIPALAGFAGGLLSGLVSDRILRRTGNLTLARKAPVYVGITVSVLATLACLLTHDLGTIVALMALAFFGKQVGTLGWTLVADLAPRNRLAFTGSVVNGVGNLSGVFTPLLIGWLVARTGNFDAALVAVALHGVVAVLAHLLITGPLQRMRSL